MPCRGVPCCGVPPLEELRGDGRGEGQLDLRGERGEKTCCGEGGLGGELARPGDVGRYGDAIRCRGKVFGKRGGVLRATGGGEDVPPTDDNEGVALGDDLGTSTERCTFLASFSPSLWLL